MFPKIVLMKLLKTTENTQEAEAGIAIPPHFPRVVPMAEQPPHLSLWAQMDAVLFPKMEPILPIGLCQGQQYSNPVALKMFRYLWFGH